MAILLEPRIEVLAEKKLIGMHLSMSLTDNKTQQLWKGFTPRRKEIKNNLTDELISMQDYDHSYNFSSFDPNAYFQKWAAIEVADFDLIPVDMRVFTLKGGLYAVFHYKGLSTDTKIFEYIFRTWLPQSKYELDQRPHFEILGEKYKNNDPHSEEEIWIPIKMK